MNQVNNRASASSLEKGSATIIIIILLVLVFGVWYFWGRSDSGLESIQTQSSSDEAAVIEADLNATDVNNPDYDLDESNFNAS